MNEHLNNESTEMLYRVARKKVALFGQLCFKTKRAI